jgi:hypothetical protein
MLELSRRRMLGSSMVAASAVLGALGMSKKAEGLAGRGQILLDRFKNPPKGLYEAASFPLLEAIQGRRSRRFAKGSAIPAGPFAYSSKHDPAPLTELEQLILLTTVAGNTGWSNLIPYNQNYHPNIPNYAAASGGRSFPSAAGFHTTDIFFTDDKGTYFFPTKDMEPAAAPNDDVPLDLSAYLEAHKGKIVQLDDKRLHIPKSPNHMEAHNNWCANVPGSTLVIPVSDLAQHHILNLCYLVQSGACIFDDIKGRSIPGMEGFRSLVDTENAYPMTYLDQMSLTEVTVECSTSCYSGMLMLQALGLGGWMYGGINPFSILGASGDNEVPGLGFRFDTDERWPIPNVTGLEGVFEGHCPPHFGNMRAAVDAVADRKFGSGGPYNANTGGPYKNNAEARSGGARHNEEFRDCVTLMAQYIFDEYGKFPATVPSIFTMMYLQAHQLDTGFYDKYHNAGGYLRTHQNHHDNWQ